ncbi:hypothetical protein FRC02_003625 [Tulasnella sp. 418]|nr:hypothetical protein FRC02_003625 [Tulasnella sp. 418]
MHEGKALAVAKIYKRGIGNNDDIGESFKDPVDAHRKMGTLFGQSAYPVPLTLQGKEIRLPCIFMKYETGVSLPETQGYKNMVEAKFGPSEDGGPWNWHDQLEADDHDWKILRFYTKVAEDCANVAIRYSTAHEIDHDDLHLGNILFPPNYPYTREMPVFIDWDSWNDSQGVVEAWNSYNRVRSKIENFLGIYGAPEPSGTWQEYMRGLEKLNGQKKSG